MANMYEITIPVLMHGLSSLDKILDKAEAYAREKDFDSVNLVQSKLFPNMLPLTKQIQIVSDTAKGCAARLSGTEAPKFEDNEASMDELRERIQKTIKYLKTIKSEDVNDTEENPIELKLPKNTLNFKGLAYVNHFVLPNFYFHISIAYAILRQGGLDLGKRDYLGG